MKRAASKPKKAVKRKSTPKKKAAPIVIYPAIEPDDEELTRRLDWERNQQAIGDAYAKLMLKQKKFPTIEALAKETGLSTKTIHRHQEDAPVLDKVMEEMKLLRQSMLVQFVQTVTKSEDSRMWDLFWTLTEKEYAESKRKKKVDITTGGEKINEGVNYSKLSTKTLQELLDASEPTGNKS